MKKLIPFLIFLSALLFTASTGNIDINKFRNLNLLSQEEIAYLNSSLLKIDADENLNFVIPLNEHIAAGIGSDYQIIKKTDTAALKSIVLQLQQGTQLDSFMFIENDETLSPSPGAISPIIINPGGTIEICIVPEVHRYLAQQAPVKKWIEDIIKSNPEREICILREGAPYQGLVPLKTVNDNIDNDILDAMFLDSRIGFSDILALKYQNVKIFGISGRAYAEHAMSDYKVKKYFNEILNEGRTQSVVNSYNNILSLIRKKQSDYTASEIEIINKGAADLNTLNKEVLQILADKNYNPEKFLSLAAGIDQTAPVILKADKTNSFIANKNKYVNNVMGYHYSRLEFWNDETIQKRDKDIYGISAQLARQIHKRNSNALIILQIGNAHFYRLSGYDIIPELRPNVKDLLKQNSDIRYTINNSNLPECIKRGGARDLSSSDSFIDNNLFGSLNPVPDPVFFSYDNSQFNFPDSYVNFIRTKSRVTFDIYRAAEKNRSQISVSDKNWNIYYSDKRLDNNKINDLVNSSDYFAGTMKGRKYIACDSSLDFENYQLPDKYKTGAGNTVILSGFKTGIKDDLASVMYSADGMKQLFTIFDSVSQVGGIHNFEINSSASVITIYPGKIIVPSFYNLSTVKQFFKSYSLMHDKIKGNKSAVHAGWFYKKSGDLLECGPLADDFFKKMRNWSFPDLPIDKTPYLGTDNTSLIYDLIYRKNLYYKSISIMFFAFDPALSESGNICKN